MAERKIQTASIETITGALRVMGAAADELRELTQQTSMATDASIHGGAGVPSVDVMRALQNKGNRSLGDFRRALDSLIVGGKQRTGSLSEDQPDWEGTARGGTDTD